MFANEEVYNTSVIKCQVFFLGGFVKALSCHLFAPLCTPFLYTAVANKFPAQHFDKAVAKPSAFGFKG